ADAADRRGVRHDLADMAVLAIFAADLFCRSDDCRPNRRCGTLRTRLPLERFLPLHSAFLADLVDECLNLRRIQMTSELGFNHSRMHSRGADATPAVAPVKRDGEKNVRGLRAAVGDERLVKRSLKIGIFKIYVGKAVTCGREVD